MNLLIFDVDGTLTATNEVDTRCFARAFLETFGIALNTSWHIYPHRTDSGIICHSFSQHFRRTPTAIELDLFRERFLILLEREWRTAPQDFAAIAGATRAFMRIAQQRDYALTLATGGWRASALFKLEKGGIPVLGLPAAFADDAAEREENCSNRDRARKILSSARVRSDHSRGGFRLRCHYGGAPWTRVRGNRG